MDKVELRHRLSSAAAELLQPALVRPDHADVAAAPDDHTLIAAAVLVPIITGPDPSVLLTKRTSHLRTHAGQVSFPGGRIDPEDVSPEAAALRESFEEIGLDPETVELVGRLSPHVTGTGYRIIPVLGLLPPDPLLAPSPHEVAAVFRLPLAVVMDPAAPQRKTAFHRGNWREFWVWPHGEHHIWGATAAILVQLAHLLREKNE